MPDGQLDFNGVELPTRLAGFPFPMNSTEILLQERPILPSHVPKHSVKACGPDTLLLIKLRFKTTKEVCRLEGKDTTNKPMIITTCRFEIAIQ